MTKKNTNKRASKRAAMPSGRDVAVIVRAMRPSTLEKLQRRVDFMRGDMRDVIEEVERVQFLTRVRRGTTSALEKAISMTVHEALMAAANALEDADAALENLDAEIGDAMAEKTDEAEEYRAMKAHKRMNGTHVRDELAKLGRKLAK